MQWSVLQRHAMSAADETARGTGSAPWAPNADVFESTEGIIVRFELAGVPSEAIELSVSERVLVLRGFRHDPQTPSSTAGYRFRQMELDYGPFERVIPLPFPVEADAARATLKLGILTVYLPRAQETPPKSARIEVRFS